MPDFANPAPPVEVHQVDSKLHEKRVDRFAWHDPQSFARFQPLVFEQPNPPFGAGVGDLHSFAQHLAPGMIPHLYLQS